MIDANHLRLNVIRPVLQHLSPEIPYSTEAEDLLMGTAAQESRLGTWLVQLNNGPARGIWQMEPATYRDIHANFLAYRQTLLEKVEDFNIGVISNIDPEDSLTGNLYYACAMVRVHYYRQPEAMPTDKEGYAKFWKDRYNSHLGKGTEEEFLVNYEHYVA